MKQLGIMKNAQKRPEKAAKIAEEPRRASAPADLPNSTVTGLEIPPGSKMQLFFTWQGISPRFGSQDSTLTNPQDSQSLALGYHPVAQRAQEGL